MDHSPAVAVDDRLSRLKRLSDGIYMLSMVLMVLQFDLPDLSHALDDQELKRFLWDQLPALRIYISTFILIVFYWLSHLMQFRHYRSTNGVHLWLTLLSLMGVVVLPYANDLCENYPLSPAVQIFYSLDLLYVGLFSMACWFYSNRQANLIDDQLSLGERRAITLEGCLEPAVCLVSVVACLRNPLWWEPSFLLLFPAYGLLGWLLRQRVDPDDNPASG